MDQHQGERMNRVYIGQRTIAGAAEVWADGKPFVPRPEWQRTFPYPAGFEWGYRGAGPLILALALLLDATDGDLAIARRHYTAFMQQVVSQFHPHGFATNRLNVLRWLCEQDRSYDPFGPSDNGNAPPPAA